MKVNSVNPRSSLIFEPGTNLKRSKDKREVTINRIFHGWFHDTIWLPGCNALTLFVQYLCKCNV